MTSIKILFCAALALFAVSASCEEKGKSVFAYKNIQWADSIPAAKSKLGQGRELGPDIFGVYCFAKYLEYASPERDVIERLMKIYHMKMIKIEAGKSEAALYWLELNNKNRKSEMLDDILRSELAMVRIVYSYEIKFDDVLKRQKESFGEPEMLKQDKMLWDGSKNAKPIKDKEEFHWEKDGVSVRLYDWTKEGGGAELIISRDELIKKYREEMRNEAQLILDAINKEKEAGEHNALSI